MFATSNEPGEHSMQVEPVRLWWIRKGGRRPRSFGHSYQPGFLDLVAKTYHRARKGEGRMILGPVPIHDSVTELDPVTVSTFRGSLLLTLALNR